MVAQQPEKQDKEVKIPPDVASVWKNLYEDLDQRDELARRDPTLRLAMLDIIPAIHELIEEKAGKLAAQAGDAAQWEVDSLAEEIWWQFQEFATRTSIPRHDEYYFTSMRFHQLTIMHTAHWFDLEFFPTTKLWGIPPSETAPGGQES